MLNNEETSIPDLIFAATPSLNEEYKSRNLNSELCYHYFDENIINKINLDNKKFDLTLWYNGYKGSPHNTRSEYTNFKRKTNIKIIGNKRIKEKYIIQIFKNIFPNFKTIIWIVILQIFI